MIKRKKTDNSGLPPSLIRYITRQHTSYHSSNWVGNLCPEVWLGPLDEDIFLTQLPAMVGGQPTSTSSTRVCSTFAHTLPSQHLTRQSLSISLLLGEV